MAGLALEGRGPRSPLKLSGNFAQAVPLRLMSPEGQARISRQNLHAILLQRVLQKKCQFLPVTGPGRLGASFQLAQGAWQLSPILLDAKK